MNQLLLDSRDTRYVLFEMLAVDKLNLYEKYSGHDREIYEDTLCLAEKIAARQFYPVNAEGDHAGVRYDRVSGAVTTPKASNRLIRPWLRPVSSASRQTRPLEGWACPLPSRLPARNIFVRPAGH